MLSLEHLGLDPLERPFFQLFNLKILSGLDLRDDFIRQEAVG